LARNCDRRLGNSAQLRRNHRCSRGRSRRRSGNWSARPRNADRAAKRSCGSGEYRRIGQPAVCHRVGFPSEAPPTQLYVVGAVEKSLLGGCSEMRKLRWRDENFRRHSPNTTRKILECLGLPTRPPPLALAVSGLTYQIDS